MRCKFICIQIIEYTTMYNYNFSPVCSTDPDNENKAFWDDTPSGGLQFSIKKSRGKLFTVGTEYYIDISEYP